MTQSTTGQGLSSGLTWLFAIAGGAAVGNLYWAQPLLVQMATDLGVAPATAGLLVTVTQIGYALGILLVVPLGDALRRDRLIPAVMASSVVGLLAAAFAPGFAMLALALGLVGFSSVAGQLIIPLAGDLATAAQRGRAVGTIVSGVLIGVLISRTASGLIASVWGWRAVYGVAVVITLTLLLLIARATPRLPIRAAVSYPQLIASVFTTTARIPAARWLLLIAGFTFGVFNLFWTAATFLLSSAPYGYSTAQIGLVSLVGIAGAVAAQRVGILEDRGHGTAAMGVFGLVAVVGLAITLVGPTSIWSVLVGALILNVGIQGAGVLTQTRLLSLSADARSRLNTALVTSNFLFGATFSALATWLWALGGWPAVASFGLAALGLGLLTWTATRARLNAVPS
ncbi:MAG: MFS transporter [Propionibacteriaceae bacterium]